MVSLSSLELRVLRFMQGRKVRAFNVGQRLGIGHRRAETVLLRLNRRGVVKCHEITSEAPSGRIRICGRTYTCEAS